MSTKTNHQDAVYMLLFGIYVFTFVMSFVGWIYYYRGSEVFKVSFPIDSLKDTVAYTIENIKIPEKLRACEVEIVINPAITQKYGADLIVEFYNASDSLCGNIEGDIYYDFGRDSDGAWTERKTENSKYFQLPAGGGVFSVDLFLNTAGKGILKDELGNKIFLKQEGTIKIYTPDGLLSTYFGWIFIFCILILGLIWILNSI